MYKRQPVDRDPCCGYNGIIDNECPKCHRTEEEGPKFERIRRITGYLVGQRIVVPTNGKTATPGAPTPNIILTNYTYGDKVSAGQVFHLNMEFMNTSQGSPIENVVISLETGEGLSINSSSNTFYVPKMGPGERKNQQVDVQALFQTKDSKVQSPMLF